MKVLVLAGFTLASLVSCKSAPPALQSVVTAAQGAICPLAQELADQGGSKLASMTGASNPLACGSDLYQPLVNANICNQPIPAAPAGSAFAKMAVERKWTKIGDITKGDLDKLKEQGKADLVGPKGVIVSGVLCPLGVGVGMGVFSTAIPKDCQGPNNLSASDADKAIVNVCQMLTAALP